MNSWRIAAFLVTAFFAILGLDWGLPSTARSFRLLGSDPSPQLLRRLARDHIRSLQSQYGGGSLTIAESTFNEAAFAGMPAAPLGWSLATALALSSDHDETHSLIASHQAYPGRTGFRARWSLYGGAYAIPLRAALWAGRRLATSWQKLSLLELERPEQGRWLFLFGRALSVAGLLACLGLCLGIGKLCGYEDDDIAASALLFTLSPAAITQAHLMKPHLWTAMLSLLFAWFILRFRRDSRTIDLLGSGIVFGLALGSGLNAMLFLLLPPFVLWRRRVPAFPASAAALAAAGVFLLLNPGLMRTLPFAREQTRMVLAGYHPRLDPLANLGFLWGACVGGLGLPAALVAGFGLWRRCRRSGSDGLSRSLSAFCLAVCAAASIMFAGFGTAESRFLLAVLALAALHVPEGLRGIIRLVHRPRLAGPAWALLLLSQCAAAGIMDVNFVLDSRDSSNSARAAGWIEKHLPPGSAIGMTQPIPSADLFPIFEWERYRLYYMDPNEPTASAESRGLSAVVFSPRSPWPVSAELEKDSLHTLRFEALRHFEFLNRLTHANFPVRIYLPQSDGTTIGWLGPPRIRI